MNSTLGYSRLLAVALCGVALAACNAIDNGGNETNFAPQPAPKVVLRGTATGLGGKPLVLQNNGANDRSFTNPVSTVADASPVSFGAVPKGSAYNVTVKTQPAGRICTVDAATASGVANADVTNLTVTCVRDSTVPLYTVSATVSNLVAPATGLKIKLATEDGDELVAVASSATPTTFTFPATRLMAGSAYTVSIGTRPTTSGTPHNCSIANPAGAIPTSGGANVTNVAISCSFTVGGTAAFPLVFGPPPAIGTGGVGVSLSVAGGAVIETMNVTTASFQFPTLRLSTASAFYSVAITSQPAGQTCVLKSGGGLVSVNLTTPGNVTSIGIACISSPALANQLTGTYRLGRDVLTFFANGTFLFGTHPAAGGTPASGVEQGFYGTVPGFTPPGGQTLNITTDANAAGGLSNAGADFGYVNLTGVTKTATTIAFSKVPTFGGAATGPFTYTAAASTAGKLTGAWVTADAQRVFVYNTTDGTGFHVGVNGGAPNLQDVCLTIADPTLAVGTYTQNRSATTCTITGGIVDTDPTAALGALFGLPGGPPFGGGANPAIGYTVTAGAPDTLGLQPAGGTAVNWSRSVPN